MQYPWLKFAILSTGIILLLWLGWGCWSNLGEVSGQNLGNYAALALKPPRLTPSRQRDLAGKKLIALTFDDGPSKFTTGRLLEVLEEKNAVATFFVLGMMVEKNPELLQLEVSNHEVGSHTMSHVALTKLSADELCNDTKMMDTIFIELTGEDFKLERPPYGSTNDDVKNVLDKILVTWTIDPEDWKVKNATAVRQRVVQSAFDGAIVLLHDIYETTVDAVAGIIDDLRSQGYEFVTVSELAEIRGVKLEKGTVYGSFRP